MALSILTLSIISLRITNGLLLLQLNVVMLSVIMLNVAAPMNADRFFLFQTNFFERSGQIDEDTFFGCCKLIFWTEGFKNQSHSI